MEPFDDPRLLRELNTTLEDVDPEGPVVARVVVWPDRAPTDGAGVRLGVLAGSFDPLHTAHVAYLERGRAAGLDVVCYALSRRIVDKERAGGMAMLDRLSLLVLDAREREGAGVLLLNRGLYVDQAEAIRAALPRLATLDFLVGYDKIVQIFDPRYYPDRDAALARLFALAGVLVAPRGDRDSRDLAALLARPENRRFAGAVRALDLPPDLADVSSTQARHAAARAEASADLPPLVARFIAATGVYAPPTNSRSGETADRYAERLAKLGRYLEAGRQSAG